jgi:hypothetical protein
MAAILRGVPQVLDISAGPAEITLFDSPDPNAQVTLVFSAGDGDCELHAVEALDEGALYIPDLTGAAPFSVGPFALAGAPRWVDQGAGSATTATVQVLQITG